MATTWKREYIFLKTKIIKRKKYDEKKSLKEKARLEIRETFF